VGYGFDYDDYYFLRPHRPVTADWNCRLRLSTVTAD
jgi:hypothetical protein